eukprot:GEMP01007270.1.p2 GENE.GEMP01007270.1~~GEMP01007270.1.p2  ORF type:complete len:299 (-),score=51.83 GEMP01007270.1:2747-3643(-)
MMFQLSSSEEEEYSVEGWIAWFCGIRGHEFFAEVDEDYIRDNFNLYGLRNRVQYYDHAMEMVLSSEVPDEDDLTDNQYLEIYRDATDLYALIHSRYITSPRGLQVMREKYQRGAFGYCPRALCNKQHVLPVGTSEELHVGRIKAFCPKCEQLYTPRAKYADNDGSFFGTSFAHVFLQSFPAVIPLDPAIPYQARLFGFIVRGKRSMLERAQKEGHLFRGDTAVSSGSKKKDRDNGAPAMLPDIRTRAIPLVDFNEGHAGGSPTHSSDVPRRLDTVQSHIELADEQEVDNQQSRTQFIA